MGKQGLHEVAMQNAQKAAYAAQQITAIDGFSLPFSAPSFNEFVVRGPKPATEVLEGARQAGVIGGLALSKYYAGQENDLLIAVTETNSKAQIDALVGAFRD
jgi:glycine dehydrogenase subunit 1